MFDNFKCITAAAGAAGKYIADRMEHASIEANADDALALAKKVNHLQEEGGLAVSIFNSFQSGKKINITLEENNND